MKWLGSIFWEVLKLGKRVAPNWNCGRCHSPLHSEQSLLFHGCASTHTHTKQHTPLPGQTFPAGVRGDNRDVTGVPSVRNRALTPSLPSDRQTGWLPVSGQNVLLSQWDALHSVNSPNCHWQMRRVAPEQMETLRGVAVTKSIANATNSTKKTHSQHLSTIVVFSFFFLSSAAAATTSTRPHHSVAVGAAHLAAQACAFCPACCAAASAATHASRRQPAYLPRPGQNGQVPQPRRDDVAGLLLWLIRPLRHSRGTTVLFHTHSSMFWLRTWIIAYFCKNMVLSRSILSYSSPNTFRLRHCFIRMH